jgi:hypothetical protein
VRERLDSENPGLPDFQFHCNALLHGVRRDSRLTFIIELRPVEGPVESIAGVQRAERRGGWGGRGDSWRVRRR